eukprot:10046363-Ditylum_brightwellii.AAC.1
MNKLKFQLQTKAILKKSSKRPLTTPTSKPTEPHVPDELILMMQKMQFDMDNDFQARQQKNLNYFNS